MKNIGGYYSAFSDEQEDSLAISKQISENKRLVTADFRDLFLSTSNDLRDKETKFGKLKNKFIKIAGNLKKAIVGADRLRNPVSETSGAISPRLDLQRLTDNLNQTIKSNENTGYVLNRARRSLDEVATVAELVATTIKSKLADKHKKLAALKELGLRLHDVEELLVKAEDALNLEEGSQKQLLDTIQELLHSFGIKLPQDIESANLKKRMVEIIETSQEKLRNHEPLGHLAGLDETNMTSKVKRILGDVVLVGAACAITLSVLKYTS